MRPMEHIRLAIKIEENTYGYFSNYDSKFNEVPLPVRLLSDIDHKSYRSLVVKLFNSYTRNLSSKSEHHSGNFRFLSGGQCHLNRLEHPVRIWECPKNTAKIENKIHDDRHLTLRTINSPIPLSLRLRVTRCQNQSQRSWIDIQEPYANKKEIEVKEDVKGRNVVIKAVSNGTRPSTATSPSFVENPDDKPIAITTIDSKMIRNLVS